MTSSNQNIFRVTLCGKISRHRWNPLTKASNADLWCFSLVCAWINGWINNREAGDLRRHRTHYDIVLQRNPLRPFMNTRNTKPGLWRCHGNRCLNQVNSLTPGGFENIFQNVFFKLISWIDTLSNSCETALRSMPQNPSDDKSTLVQVMAWCRQAASHYLSQCCPRSLSPYGVTRPQWVKADQHETHLINIFNWE